MSYVELDFNLVSKSTLLTSTHKQIVKKIHLLSKEKGYCWATNQFFAEELGLSASGINKAITKLVELGFVNRVIVRDDRKMVIERKLTLSTKFIKIFVVKTTEEIKKTVKKVKKMKTNKNNENKPTNKFDSDKEYPVSNEIEVMFKKLFGEDKFVDHKEQLSKHESIINDSERIKSVLLRVSNSNINSNLFNYLESAFKNEKEFPTNLTKKNNKHFTRRIELTPDWLFNNENIEQKKQSTKLEQELFNVMQESMKYFGKPEFDKYAARIEELKKLVKKQEDEK